jgi:hypothetical protein
LYNDGTKNEMVLPFHKMRWNSKDNFTWHQAPGNRVDRKRDGKNNIREWTDLTFCASQTSKRSRWIVGDCEDNYCMWSKTTLVVMGRERNDDDVLFFFSYFTL